MISTIAPPVALAKQSLLVGVKHIATAHNTNLKTAVYSKIVIYLVVTPRLIQHCVNTSGKALNVMDVFFVPHLN